MHDVTVITRSNNRGRIDSGLAGTPGPHPDFIYYDLPRFLRFLKSKGLPVFIYYLLWQIGARFALAGRIDKFDLIHHATFNSFRQPGFWWCCGRPVILGPLGGGQIAPWRLLGLFRHFVLEILRSVSVICAPFSPFFLASWISAKTVIFSNQDTAYRIPYRFGKRTRFMVDVGIEVAEFSASTASPISSEVGLIWVGRLDEYKAPLLALEAFARAYRQDQRLRLIFVGDGQEASLLKQGIGKMGLQGVVSVTGRVVKSEVSGIMSRQMIFIFTSLRDTSGNVILEAMASGLPSICLNHHGASEMHTYETALLVEPGSVEETKQALAEAIVKLAASPELIKSMGAKAKERVGQFDWPIRAKVMDEIYREAIRDSVSARRRPAM